MIDLSAKATVVHGEAYQLLRALPDASADGIVVDPPYSSGGATRGDRMASTSLKYQQHEARQKFADFSGDNRDQRGFLAWCALWLAECLRVSRPGAPIVFFTDWRQLPQATDALQVGGWIWRGIVPWDKTLEARPQLGRYRAQCEYMLWGSNGAMPFDRGVGALPGLITESPVGPQQRQHLTEKPVRVMRLAVELVPRGGLVLDPFCGSGSTGVAAMQLGRRFLGFELLPSNVTIARRRIAQADPAHSAQEGCLL